MKNGVTTSRLHGLLIGPTTALHEILEFSADSYRRHSPRKHSVLVRYENVPGHLPVVVRASGLPSGGNELAAARQLAEAEKLNGDPTKERNMRALLIARTVLLQCTFQDRQLSLLAAQLIVK
jgi:hypothetical protein